MRLWHCRGRISVLGEKWSETDDTCSWLCTGIFNSRCIISIKWGKNILSPLRTNSLFHSQQTVLLNQPLPRPHNIITQLGRSSTAAHRGFALSPQLFPPRKRGNKTRRLIRWGWSGGGFPHLWHFPLSQPHSCSWQPDCLLRSRLSPFPHQV